MCTSEIAIEKRRDRAREGGREGEKERANEARGREIKRGKREVRPIEEDGARETCGEAAHSRHSRENERVGTPYARGSRGDHARDRTFSRKFIPSSESAFRVLLGSFS